MTRIARERLKDGRLRGAVGRRILAALVRRPGEVVCPEFLRDEVWPNGAPLHWRVNIARIRTKLGAAKPLIGTRFGMGYVLRLVEYTGPTP